MLLCVIDDELQGMSPEEIYRVNLDQGSEISSYLWFPNTGFGGRGFK
jgi:hypothetical protein